MIGTILVPLDGSAVAERALPYAVHLARAAGARLILLHASSDLALLSRLEAGLNVTLNLERHLDALRRSGIEAAARTSVGLPLSAILATARDDRADLILMSTHGRGGIGRWIYGSVADQVLRAAEVPVLLVSALCDHPWESDRPFRILVPLDGSLHSETALKSARDLAESVPAELLLVRAIEEPAPETYRYGMDGQPISVPEGEGELEEARQYLEVVAGREGKAYGAVDVQADIGDAPGVIAGAAHRGNVDLIVMATHGRAGLERLALGSVASSVLHQAHTPILLVRPSSLQQQATEQREEVVHR